MGSLVKDTAANKMELRLALIGAIVAMSFPHLKVTFTLLNTVLQGWHSLGEDNVIGNVARCWLQKLILSLYSYFLIILIFLTRQAQSPTDVKNTNIWRIYPP